MKTTTDQQQEDYEQGLRCRNLWSALLVQLVTDSIKHLNSSPISDPTEALECKRSFEKLTAWGEPMEVLCDLAGADFASFKFNTIILLDRSKEIGSKLTLERLNKVVDNKIRRSYNKI